MLAVKIDGILLFMKILFGIAKNTVNQTRKNLFLIGSELK
jgi:hypothetical protein